MDTVVRYGRMNTGAVDRDKEMACKRGFGGQIILPLGRRGLGSIFALCIIAHPWSIFFRLNREGMLYNNW
jgi:hypothetical protein